VTLAEVSPAVADTPVGAPGAVAGATGVTDDEGALAEPVPTALEAVTKNVYAVPLASPDTVALDTELDTVTVSPPDEVTV
jgi:hypothetical protein